jgi:hypothetical protein
LKKVKTRSAHNSATCVRASSFMSRVYLEVRDFGRTNRRYVMKYPNSGVGFDLRLFDLGSFFVLLRRQEISIGHSRCKRQSGLTLCPWLFHRGPWPVSVPIRLMWFVYSFDIQPNSEFSLRVWFRAFGFCFPVSFFIEKLKSQMLEHITNFSTIFRTLKNKFMKK